MVIRDSLTLCDVFLDRSLCNFPIPSIMPMRGMEYDTLYYDIVGQIAFSKICPSWRGGFSMLVSWDLSNNKSWQNASPYPNSPMRKLSQ